jgi:(E)-4-hydroxy-3-methylbut-2-enyl-diphosphate synthase
MQDEFSVCYPLHLGVTEAGDGEDGRIKSAIGIGTLLEDGIGDTIRVSLTEDPEFEIPVCRDLVKRYAERQIRSQESGNSGGIPELKTIPWSPFEYRRRESLVLGNIGGKQVPVVLGDFSDTNILNPETLQSIGYVYNAETDKWNISDAAADYIYTGIRIPDFPLPGTLKVICDHQTWETVKSDDKYLPLLTVEKYFDLLSKPAVPHFVVFDVSRFEVWPSLIAALHADENVILCLQTSHFHAMPSVRRFVAELMEHGIHCPVLICVESREETVDEQLIHLSTDAGALFLEGIGDGIWLRNNMQEIRNIKVSGRTYLEVRNNHQFLNNTAFSILQATRTRISKTEYISCPSCGRTLFDLQETTAKIRARTHHLKGVKIAIMGCIVNGPGEMADADFGYVGSGPGKITLYKGKEIVKRNVDSEIAVEELISLLKDNEAWIEP